MTWDAADVDVVAGDERLLFAAASVWKMMRMNERRKGKGVPVCYAILGIR